MDAATLDTWYALGDYDNAKYIADAAVTRAMVAWVTEVNALHAALEANRVKPNHASVDPLKAAYIKAMRAANVADGVSIAATDALNAAKETYLSALAALAAVTADADATTCNTDDGWDGSMVWCKEWSTCSPPSSTDTDAADATTCNREKETKESTL